MALNFPNSPTVGQIYTDVTSGFSYEWDGTVWKSYSPASASNIKILDDLSGSFNGVTQTFALTTNGVSITPANAQQLRIVLGGVVQSPGVDYTVNTSNITFTDAPTAGLTFSGVSQGPAVPVTYANDGNIYIRNTYTGAGTTGPFAFSQGYTVGYLDVYRNGVRLRSGTDFVGTSGTNFFLTDAAASGDELEAIGYTITSIINASTSFDNLNVTGITTTNRLQVTTNANVVGVVTASGFVGNLTGTATTATTAGYATTAGIATVAQGLSGTPNITVGNVTGSAATFTNLTVNGTQTIINTTSLEITDKNIGIGSTSTPSDASSDGAGIVVYGTTNKSLTWSNTSKNWSLVGGGLTIPTGNVGFSTVTANYPFQVGSGSTIVFIDNQGDLGIGTTNTTSKLHVVGGESRFAGIIETVSVATTYMSGSAMVLEMDVRNATTYTYTIPTGTNIGIVSFKNMPAQSNSPSGATITLLVTQNSAGTGNTTATTGIGTNCTIVGYENGASVSGISTRALVGSGTTITLSTTSNDVDFVSFFINYNGNSNISTSSYRIYATKNGGFR